MVVGVSRAASVKTLPRFSLPRSDGYRLRSEIVIELVPLKDRNPKNRYFTPVHCHERNVLTTLLIYLIIKIHEPCSGSVVTPSQRVKVVRVVMVVTNWNSFSDK